MKDDLKNKIIWSSLKSGLLIFLIGIGLWLIRAAFPLMWFLFITPGIIYGIANIPKLPNVKRPGWFFLASSLIYSLCFFIATCNHGNIAPVSVISASLTGSILLFTCYYFSSGREVRFVRSLVLVILLSIISVTPSAICSYFTAQKYQDYNSNLLMIGVLSVFPLWQILFSLGLIISVKNIVSENI